MQEAEVARSDNCNRVLHKPWLYKVFWSFTPNISVYNVYAPHCSLDISYDANKENLLKKTKISLM